MVVNGGERDKRSIKKDKRGGDKRKKLWKKEEVEQKVYVYG